MKRRNFIYLTISSVGAIMVPSCKNRTVTAFSRPLFLSTVCDSQTLKHIGTSYRTKTPAEAEEGRLIELLSTGLPQGADQDRQLDSLAKRDYAAGRTVIIDGWVLSLTEARQCAVFSLQKQ
jgi:hypothetical protein